MSLSLLNITASLLASSNNPELPEKGLGFMSSSWHANTVHHTVTRLCSPLAPNLPPCSLEGANPVSGAWPEHGNSLAICSLPGCWPAVSSPPGTRVLRAEIRADVSLQESAPPSPICTPRSLVQPQAFCTCPHVHRNAGMAALTIPEFDSLFCPSASGPAPRLSEPQFPHP